MHIDFKITTWERVHIPNGKEEIVRKALEEGKIQSANDVWGISEQNFTSPNYWEPELERLVEVVEQISPEENDGQTTVEAYEEKNDLTPFWTNIKK